MTIWLAFVPLGIFVGLLSGLFGIGGGVLMVPGLFFLLKSQGFTEDHAIIFASRTSLAVILFTSFYSAYQHHLREPLRKDLLKELVLFVILGTIGGTFLVHLLNPQTLKIILMVYVLLIGLKMWFGFKPQSIDNESSSLLNLVVGGIIGLKSAVLGIGGGTISIPYLTWRGVPMTQAAGISAALGFVIAITGTSTELIKNYDALFEVPYQLGNIYLPGLVGILSTSLIFAKIGTKLGHKLPQQKMRKGFAILLLLISLRNFYSLLIA